MHCDACIIVSKQIIEMALYKLFSYITLANKNKYRDKCVKQLFCLLQTIHIMTSAVTFDLPSSLTSLTSVTCAFSSCISGDLNELSSIENSFAWFFPWLKAILFSLFPALFLLFCVHGPSLPPPMSCSLTELGSSTWSSCEAIWLMATGSEGGCCLGHGTHSNHFLLLPSRFS